MDTGVYLVSLILTFFLNYKEEIIMNIVNRALFNFSVNTGKSFKGEEGYDINVSPCFDAGKSSSDNKKRRYLISFFSDKDCVEDTYFHAFKTVNKNNQEVIRFSGKYSKKDEKAGITILIGVPFIGKIKSIEGICCEILQTKILSTPIHENKKREKITITSYDAKCSCAKFLMIVANIKSENYNVDAGIKVNTVRNDRNNRTSTVKKVYEREDYITFGITPTNEIPSDIIDCELDMDYIPDFNDATERVLTQEEYNSLQDELKIFTVKNPS